MLIIGLDVMVYQCNAQGDTHAAHEAEYPDLASLSVFIDSPWSAWTEVNIARINLTVIQNKELSYPRWWRDTLGDVSSILISMAASPVVCFRSLQS